MNDLYPKSIGLIVHDELKILIDSILEKEFSTIRFAHVDFHTLFIDPKTKYDVLVFDACSVNKHTLKTASLLHPHLPQILIIEDADIENFLSKINVANRIILLRSEINKTTMKKILLLAKKHAQINQKYNEYRQNYTDLFDLSPLAIFIINPENNCIISANLAAYKLFGYYKSELENQHISCLFKEELAEVYVSRVMTPIGKRRLYQIGELQMEHKDQFNLWFNVFVNSITNNNIELRTLICIDITSNKQREKEFSQQLIETQDKERILIGRELHDNFSQLLVTAYLTIEMFVKSQEKDPQLLLESQKMIDRALMEMRAVSHSLAPVYATFNTIEDNILKLIEEYTISSRFQLDLYIDQRAGCLVMVQESSIHFVRILQNVFNNILIHSKANCVSISLEYEIEGMMLTIKDDGIGFSNDAKIKGIGLFNIRKRVEILNGRISIYSTLDHGCFIQMFLPWKDNIRLDQEY